MTDTAVARAAFEPDLAPRHEEPEFLSALRHRAAASFKDAGLPTPRQEAWRFTNLKELAATPWTVAPKTTAAPDVRPWLLADTDTLVFVNGWLQADLSDTRGLPGEVVATSLAEALERWPRRVEANLGQAVPEGQPFAELNTASFADGAYVEIPPGAVLERPLHLLFVSVAGTEPSLSWPRALIVAGRGSQARVVESHVGLPGRYLACPVTELLLEDGAVLTHHRLQAESGEGAHVAVQATRQERDTTLSSALLSIGAELARTDVHAVLAGSGSTCSLDGLYLAEGRQHVDHQVRVEHLAPHASSHQLFKGIMDGRSRAVFNGRIVVAQDAQKTDATQANRNLLLSRDALAHSNPQLEIFADDVRCTHGSTVGRLDEEAVFYLRSRGLPKAAAESLLTWAFASEVVDRIGVEPLRARMEETLARRLPQGALVKDAT